MSMDSSKFLDIHEDANLHSLLGRFTNRDTLILAILRHGGMRSSELLALRPKDLNHTTQTIRITATKRCLNRELPLPKGLFTRLADEAYLCLNENERIFKIGYARIHQLWEEYRPAKKKLHSLRHTFAVTMYRKTKDIRLVQKMLGHKNVSTTEIYLDFTYTLDEIRKAMWG